MTELLAGEKQRLDPEIKRIAEDLRSRRSS
jgi:hypothetical protein